MRLDKDSAMMDVDLSNGLDLTAEMAGFGSLPEFDLADIGSLENGGWMQPCQECAKLKKEMEKMKQEYALDFDMLKQKMVSTDLLIKKFQEKSKELEVQNKKSKELKKQLEKSQRESQTFRMQLQQALLDVEPLKRSKAQLEMQKQFAESQHQTLKDRLHAAEAAVKQYINSQEAMEAELAEAVSAKKEMQKEVTQLKTAQKKQDTAFKKLQAESGQKKHDANDQRKEIAALKRKLAKAEEQAEQYARILSTRGKGSHSQASVSTDSCNKNADNNKQPVASPLSPRGISRKIRRAHVPKPQPVGKYHKEVRKETSVVELLRSHGYSDSEDRILGDILSPLRRPVSPLPGSPFRGRMDVSSDSSSSGEDENEAGDDDMDNFADLLECQLQNPSPAKSSGANVPQSASLRSPPKPKRVAQLNPRVNSSPESCPTQRRGRLKSKVNAPRKRQSLSTSPPAEAEERLCEEKEESSVLGVSVAGIENLSDSDQEAEGSQVELPFQTFASADESAKPLRSPVSANVRRPSQTFSSSASISGVISNSFSDSENEDEGVSHTQQQHNAKVSQDEKDKQQCSETASKVPQNSDVQKSQYSPNSDVDVQNGEDSVNLSTEGSSTATAALNVEAGEISADPISEPKTLADVKLENAQLTSENLCCDLKISKPSDTLRSEDAAISVTAASKPSNKTLSHHNADTPAEKHDEKTQDVVKSKESLSTEPSLLDNPSNQSDALMDNPSNKSDALIDNPSNKNDPLIDNSSNKSDILSDNPSNKSDILSDNSGIKSDILSDNSGIKSDPHIPDKKGILRECASQFSSPGVTTRRRTRSLCVLSTGESGQGKENSVHKLSRLLSLPNDTNKNNQLGTDSSSEEEEFTSPFKALNRRRGIGQSPRKRAICSSDEENDSSLNITKKCLRSHKPTPGDKTQASILCEYKAKLSKSLHVDSMKSPPPSARRVKRDSKSCDRSGEEVRANGSDEHSECVSRKKQGSDAQPNSAVNGTTHDDMQTSHVDTKNNFESSSKIIPSYDTEADCDIGNLSTEQMNDSVTSADKSQHHEGRRSAPPSQTKDIADKDCTDSSEATHTHSGSMHTDSKDVKEVNSSTDISRNSIPEHSLPSLDVNGKGSKVVPLESCLLKTEAVEPSVCSNESDKSKPGVVSSVRDQCGPTTRHSVEKNYANSKQQFASDESALKTPSSVKNSPDHSEIKDMNPVSKVENEDNNTDLQGNSAISQTVHKTTESSLSISLDSLPADNLNSTDVSDESNECRQINSIVENSCLNHVNGDVQIAASENTDGCSNTYFTDGDQVASQNAIDNPAVTAAVPVGCTNHTDQNNSKSAFTPAEKKESIRKREQLDQRLVYIPSTNQNSSQFHVLPHIVRASQSAITVVSPETSGILHAGGDSVGSRSDSMVSPDLSISSADLSDTLSPVSSLPPPCLFEEQSRDTVLSSLPPSPVGMETEQMPPLSPLSLSPSWELIEPLSPLPPSPLRQSPSLIQATSSEETPMVSPLPLTPQQRNRRMSPRQFYCKAPDGAVFVRPKLPTSVSKSLNGEFEHKCENVANTKKRRSALGNKSKSGETTSGSQEFTGVMERLSQENISPQTAALKILRGKCNRNSTEETPGGEGTNTNTKEGTSPLEKKRSRKRKSPKQETPDTPAKKQVTDASKIEEPVLSVRARIVHVKNAAREIGNLVKQFGVNAQAVADRLSNPANPVPANIIVDQIIKVLQGVDCDLLPSMYTECVSTKPVKRPFLGQVEGRMMELVRALITKPNRTNLASVLCSALLCAIMKKDTTLILAKLSLCRMLTAICRHTGDLCCVRSLLYNVMYRQMPGCHAIVLAVIAVWPSVVCRSSRLSACVRVLEYAVYKRIKQHPATLLKMRTCLQKLAGWKGSPVCTGELAAMLIESLHEANRNSGNQAVVFETCKSVVLLAVTEGWQWAHHHIIEKLLPVLREPVSKNHESSDILVTAILTIFGEVCHLCPAAEFSCVMEVIKAVSGLLDMDDKICVHVQEKIMDCLIRLSAFSPLLVAMAIHKYKTMNPIEEQTAEIQQKLDIFWSMFQDKLPFVAQNANSIKST